MLISSNLVPFLPLGFAMGIDGAPAKLTGAPRGIRHTANPPTQQHYWGQKGGYGFNVCMIKNFFKIANKGAKNQEKICFDVVLTQFNNEFVSTKKISPNFFSSGSETLF